MNSEVISSFMNSVFNFYSEIISNFLRHVHSISVMTIMRQLLLAFLFTLVLSNILSAQSSKPNIYLDCQMRCYMSFVKQQITFINYMQDREEADIYILATRQRTGAGGREIQLVFEGSNQFTGMIDTISYIVDPNATESIERDQLVQQLKRGLLRFLFHTDLINNLNYSIESSGSDDLQNPLKDPWNYWVFNVGGNGSINGEQSFNGIDLSGRVSANRITDKHKFIFSTRYNYEENTYTLTDGEKFHSVSETYRLYLEYVKSISENWSIGAVSRSGSSTFGNTDVSATIRAALEYNVFPYSESQTRRFTFFYAVGPEYYDYVEPTIYDKETEWTARQSLNINYEQTEKWGDLSISFGVQQYFHNLRLYNAYFNPGLEWQIFKGFSINFGAFFSFVNDRINIAKSYISDEDILLQIKQLDTDFTYFTHFGINYRFGSKYNNFVNPRF